MVSMPHWPVHTGMNKTIDLSRVIYILHKLGNPQDEIGKVIHVGGTNGKGSTVSFISKILQTARYKVGKYTSPHLFEANERITINSEDISDKDLYYFIEVVRLKCDDLKVEPTVFEATTIAAFLYFAEHNLDYCVLEVGMGGRNDATNCISEKNLVATVLTPISDDHKKFLGDDIYDITMHKAEIQKPTVPSIIGPQPARALAALEDYAKIKNINCHAYDYHYHIEGLVVSEEEDENNESLNEEEINTDEINAIAFRFSDDAEESYYSMPSLIGDFQIINSTMAIATVKLINDSKITDDVISQALVNTEWRGRVEKIENSWINKKVNSINKENSKQVNCYFDGAHNPNGAYVLAKWMQKEKIKYKNKSQRKKDYYIIIGRTHGSDSYNFNRQFLGLVKELIGVKVIGEPIPETPEEIAKQGKRSGIPSIVKKDLKEAIDYILEKSKESQNDMEIVITGSLYLMRDIYRN